MSILLISGTALAAIVIAALILIVVVFGAIKKFFPEKPRKPLKRM
jgi:flagellar biosynthesis protein FliR